MVIQINDENKSIDFYWEIKGRGYDNVLSIIDNTCFYLCYLDMCIEIFFIYFILKNWYRKNTKLYSSFFILFTFKTSMDLLVSIYNNVTEDYIKRYNFNKTLLDVDIFIKFFTINFDITCHILICINRFTAIMMPTMYGNVSDIGYLR